VVGEGEAGCFRFLARELSGIAMRALCGGAVDRDGDVMGSGSQRDAVTGLSGG
jgi:hypothetical protein